MTARHLPVVLMLSFIVLSFGCSSRILKKGGMELTTAGVSELQFDDTGDGVADLRNEGPGTVLVVLLDENGGVMIREELPPGTEKRLKLEEIQRVHFENHSGEPADVFYELMVDGVSEVRQVDMTR